MLDTLKAFVKRIKIRFLIIAVFLSFASWFVCLNYADPKTYENFVLQLKLLNENALTDNINPKLIENRRELDNITVVVNVTGLRSELDKLRADDTIYAYIDLFSSELANISNARVGEPVPVRISVGFAGEASGLNYNIMMVSPEMVSVVLDRIKERNENVRVQRTGEVPAGYITTSAEYNPKSVVITGPSAIVSRIDRLNVEVDLSNARADIVGELPIIAYDSFGEVVTGFQLDIETVNFRIPVYKTSTVQVQLESPPYMGRPGKDVAVTEVEWEPKSVEIMVHVDDAEQVGAITLDPADITGITSATTFEYDINEYLQRISRERGTELSLVDEAAGVIRVTFITEAVITRDFDISVDKNIHLPGEASLGNRQREVLTETVTVSLRGLESLLDLVRPEDIVGRVAAESLEGLADGVHKLEVDFTIPQGLEMTGDTPTVTLRITTTAPAATPSIR